MARRLVFVVWLTVTSFPEVAVGCIMLLDGWTQLAAGERATLAEIVAYGRVRRTFPGAQPARRDPDTTPGDPAPSWTYAAELELARVVKGSALVDQLRGSPSWSDVYGKGRPRKTDASPQRQDSRDNSSKYRNRGFVKPTPTVEPPSSKPSSGVSRLFNVSNFGEASSCLSDVSEAAFDNRRLVFFLTVFDGHLSAR